MKISQNRSPFERWKPRGGFPWATNAAWWIVLVACTVLPYANSLANGFVYDDTVQVLSNPYVRSFNYIRRIFGSSVWSFTGEPSRYYRPMMTFGYLLCYKLFGFSPVGFHLVNLGLHAAVVFLLFFVTRRLFRDSNVAFGAAVLFALHPIHTESVDWIAAVTDLELTFFCLLTFLLFLLLGNVNGRRFIWTSVATMGCFALALLSKEQAVTIPLLAMAYEHLYRDDRSETSWRQKLARYAPLWILAFLYIPLRLYSLGGFVVVSNYWGLTKLQIASFAPSLFGQYLWNLVWPVNFCAFHVFDTHANLLNLQVLAGVLSIVLLCILFWRLWRGARQVSFGLIWLVVTLAPVLNPRWLGLNVFAERYLYLPSVGFCWILAWAVASWWRTLAQGRMLWKATSASVLSLVAFLCVLRIVTRNQDWKDDVTLYTRTLESAPDANLIRENLANVYKAEGLVQQAEREYRDTLERDPESVDCLNDLASLLMEQGRNAESTQLLVKAIGLHPRNGKPYVNLAIIYEGAGMVDMAAQQFRLAAEVAPQDADAHARLGSFYQRQDDHGRAAAAFQRALSINPYHNDARISLATLYEADNRKAEAVHELETVLENDPGNGIAIAGLRRMGRE